MRILPTPEIFIGNDPLKELAVFLEKNNSQTILVVTDEGIIKAGIFDEIHDVLKSSQKNIVIFDEVEPDPSIELVQKAATLARENNADAVIGIGGGSSIDTAKVAAALANNDNDIHRYLGIDLLERDPLPLVAMPTTAGTGSEVTPIAILSDNNEQVKKGLVSNKIIPKTAILDSKLTVSLPQHVTAATGMDALVHAIEAFISVNASDYSDDMAVKAMRLLSSSIKAAYDNGEDLRARENMLYGSLLAGIAFANAGVGAVHAFAYPLGGMFHIPHGLANSVMLSTILEYNLQSCDSKLERLQRSLMPQSNSIASIKAVVDYVDELCAYLKIPRNLAQLQVDGKVIPKMAESVMKITRLLSNNPRQIELDDAVKIYQNAFSR